MGGKKCTYSLRWPGLPALPLYIINSDTNAVYGKQNRLPPGKRHLNKQENKFVKMKELIHALTQDSGVVEKEITETLKILSKTFKVQEAALIASCSNTSGSGNSDLVNVELFIPVSLFLMCIMLCNSCDLLSNSQNEILDLLEKQATMKCDGCEIVRQQCVCKSDAQNITPIDTDVFIGFGTQIWDRGTQTEDSNHYGYWNPGNSQQQLSSYPPPPLMRMPDPSQLKGIGQKSKAPYHVLPASNKGGPYQMFLPNNMSLNNPRLTLAPPVAPINIAPTCSMNMSPSPYPMPYANAYSGLVNSGYPHNQYLYNPMLPTTGPPSNPMVPYGMPPYYPGNDVLPMLAESKKRKQPMTSIQDQRDRASQTDPRKKKKKKAAVTEAASVSTSTITSKIVDKNTGEGPKGIQAADSPLIVSHSGDGVKLKSLSQGKLSTSEILQTITEPSRPFGQPINTPFTESGSNTLRFPQTIQYPIKPPEDILKDQAESKIRRARASFCMELNLMSAHASMGTGKGKAPSPVVAVDIPVDKGKESPEENENKDTNLEEGSTKSDAVEPLTFNEYVPITKKNVSEVWRFITEESSDEEDKEEPCAKHEQKPGDLGTQKDSGKDDITTSDEAHLTHGKEGEEVPKYEKTTANLKDDILIILDECICKATSPAIAKENVDDGSNECQTTDNVTSADVGNDSDNSDEKSKLRSQKENTKSVETKDSSVVSPLANAASTSHDLGLKSPEMLVGTDTEIAMKEAPEKINENDVIKDESQTDEIIVVDESESSDKLSQDSEEKPKLEKTDTQEEEPMDTTDTLVSEKASEASDSGAKEVLPQKLDNKESELVDYLTSKDDDGVSNTKTLDERDGKWKTPEEQKMPLDINIKGNENKDKVSLQQKDDEDKEKTKEEDKIDKKRKWFSKFEHVPTGQTLYRCLFEKCRQCFDTRGAAKLHSEVHNAHENIHHLMCLKCDYRVPFFRWYDLVRHLKDTHVISITDSKLGCFFCGLEFSSEEKLSRHIEFHYSSRYKCVHCGLMVLSWGQMELHIESCPEKKQTKVNFGCPYCMFVFHKRNIRNLHMLSHVDSGMQCVLCPEAEEWEHWKLLRKHYQQRHAKALLGRISPFRDQLPQKRIPPRCHVCEVSYKSQDTYAQHMIKVHDFVPYTLFGCDRCEKVFRTDRRRDWHHVKVHEDEARCNKCEFIGKNKMVLRLHQAQKHAEKQHMCSDCGKSFTYYHQLSVHMAHHARKIVHTCKTCGEVFKKSSDLRTHNRTAHVPRAVDDKSQYDCPECSFYCSRKSALKQHIKREHPEVEEEEEREFRNIIDAQETNTDKVQDEEKDEEKHNIEEDVGADVGEDDDRDHDYIPKVKSPKKPRVVVPRLPHTGKRRGKKRKRLTMQGRKYIPKSQPSPGVRVERKLSEAAASALKEKRERKKLKRVEKERIEHIRHLRRHSCSRTRTREEQRDIEEAAEREHQNQTLMGGVTLTPEDRTPPISTRVGRTTSIDSINFSSSAESVYPFLDHCYSRPYSMKAVDAHCRTSDLGMSFMSSSSVEDYEECVIDDDDVEVAHSSMQTSRRGFPSRLQAAVDGRGTGSRPRRRGGRGSRGSRTTLTPPSSLHLDHKAAPYSISQQQGSSGALPPNLAKLGLSPGSPNKVLSMLSRMLASQGDQRRPITSPGARRNLDGEPDMDLTDSTFMPPEVGDMIQEHDISLIQDILNSIDSGSSMVESSLRSGAEVSPRGGHRSQDAAPTSLRAARALELSPAAGSSQPRNARYKVINIGEMGAVSQSHVGEERGASHNVGVPSSQDSSYSGHTTVTTLPVNPVSGTAFNDALLVEGVSDELATDLDEIELNEADYELFQGGRLANFKAAPGSARAAVSVSQQAHTNITTHQFTALQAEEMELQHGSNTVLASDNEISTDDAPGEDETIILQDSDDEEEEEQVTAAGQSRIQIVFNNPQIKETMSSMSGLAPVNVESCIEQEDEVIYVEDPDESIMEEDIPITKPMEISVTKAADTITITKIGKHKHPVIQQHIVVSSTGASNEGDVLEAGEADSSVASTSQRSMSVPMDHHYI